MADADNNFFNIIIMEDETWCFAYDPKTKRQSSEWVGETSPRLKKLKFQRSHIKTMLITVHKEIVPEGKTVNAEFYKGVMDRLLNRIQLVRPATFCFQDYILLHDNVSAQNYLPIFDLKKMLPPFITSVFSRFIFARLFFVPEVENEVKRTPLCGCC